MPRPLVLILLILASAVCLMALLFCWGLLMKSGFADMASLGFAVLFGVLVSAMWILFLRSRDRPALMVAAVPVVLVMIFGASFHMRLF